MNLHFSGKIRRLIEKSPRASAKKAPIPFYTGGATNRRLLAPSYQENEQVCIAREKQRKKCPYKIGE